MPERNKTIMEQNLIEENRKGMNYEKRMAGRRGKILKRISSRILIYKYLPIYKASHPNYFNFLLVSYILTLSIIKVNYIFLWTRRFLYYNYLFPLNIQIKIIRYFLFILLRARGKFLFRFDILSPYWK